MSFGAKGFRTLPWPPAILPRCNQGPIGWWRWDGKSNGRKHWMCWGREVSWMSVLPWMSDALLLVRFLKRTRRGLTLHVTMTIYDSLWLLHATTILFREQEKDCHQLDVSTVFTVGQPFQCHPFCSARASSYPKTPSAERVQAQPLEDILSNKHREQEIRY